MTEIATMLGFDGSHHAGMFAVASGLLSNAWEQSVAAYQSEKPFIANEVEDVVFFAFPTSDIRGFMSIDCDFGEGSINAENELFAYLKDDKGDPALVHQAILRRFLRIWKHTDIRDKVIKVGSTERNPKSIVFTGHSQGGAVAALATLWMLGNRQSRSQGRRENLPFCVTFGCPLMGDERFAQAVRRESLCGQFCHAVTIHDIVPRIFLAPLHSVAVPLKALLPYWASAVFSPKEPIPLSDEQISVLFHNVLQHSLAVIGSTDSTEDVIMRRSPYRPFGNYLFLSEKGAVCIENSAAVLQLLYLTLQAPGNTAETSRPIARSCISEHIEYGTTLKRLAIKTLVRNTEAETLATREFKGLDAKSPFDASIALTLEAIGVGIENSGARDALIAAGEMGMGPIMNSAAQAVELAKIQGARVEIEWYKTSCDRDGIGYYDCFKKQQEAKDIRANLLRLKLQRFWDGIIEMVEKHEVPNHFTSRDKWVNASTNYRQLVEPLDIADYYRRGKHRRNGHYLLNGRPRRYIILEKWLEERERSRKSNGMKRRQLAFLTQDSCFWGRLEEAQDCLDTVKDIRLALDPFLVAQSVDKIHNFVDHVHRLIVSRDISCDVLLEKSSFIAWWKDYTNLLSTPPSQAFSSPLIELVESEIRRLSIDPSCPKGCSRPGTTNELKNIYM